MEKHTLFLTMRWESYLSVNDRYDRRGRPRLRSVVEVWQEELAWLAKNQMALDDITWPDAAALVVDLEMRFPADGRTRDADNYLKSLFDGLEMGMGVDDSRFVPFLRSVKQVPPQQAGFTIRVYPATFAGHGITGILELLQGKTIIILDNPLPMDWRGTRVCVNLGVMRNG